MDINSNNSSLKPKKSFFMELPPIYPIGTLLQISNEYTDTICFMSVPTAATEPSNFLKAKDVKYINMVNLKSGDILYFLGTYRNKVKKRMCTYHRFLHDKTIVYAFDDAFMQEDLSKYFTILST